MSDLHGSGPATQLAIITRVTTALAEAMTLDEVLEFRAQADAVRKYAKSTRAELDVLNQAAEATLRAERRAGELLAALLLRGGDRKSNGHAARLTLADLGVSESESTRWQDEASVPSDVFQRYVAETTAAGKQLTASALRRLGKQLKQAALGSRGAPSSTTCAPTKKKPNPPMDVAAASKTRSCESKRECGFGPSAFGEEDTAHELIHEAINHVGTFKMLLGPLCSTGRAEFEPADARYLRYLLSQFGELLGQIDELASQLFRKD